MDVHKTSHTVASIIEACGGDEKISTEFGVNIRTPYHWLKGKKPGIPEERWDDVAALALRHSRTKLTAHDFHEANKLAWAQLRAA